MKIVVGLTISSCDWGFKIEEEEEEIWWISEEKKCKN